MVAWSITRSDTPDLGGDDAYSLALGATAQVGFDAAAKWPSADAAPPRLLKIGAGGEVSAGAKAKIPYSFGAVAGGVSGSAKAALDYYFNVSEGLYALAVATRLDDLANPFELAPLWDAFSDKDAALEGIVIGLGGSANAQFQVSFADSGALIDGVPIDIAATIGVTASLTTDYRLTLRRATGPGGLAIHAALTRSQLSESALSAALNLTIDVAALTKPVADAIQTAVNRWDQALKEIKPFLSPGTWLRQHALADLEAALTPLIADETLRQAILADAGGALGAGAVEDSALLGWLTGKITGAIDQTRTLVDDNTTGAVDRAVAKVTAQAPLVAKYLPADKLKAMITQQIDRVDDALRNAVTTTFQQPTDAVIAALKAAGAQIGGALDDFDAQLAAVRKLLDQYDALFQKILKTAQEAAKSKVTARIFIEERRQQQVVIEVEGDFLANTAAARAVFQDLSRGRLQALVRLFESDHDVDGFHLDRAKSSLKRFSTKSGSQGFEIVFLNIARVKFEELFTNKADVVVDGLGNVRVDLKATLDKVLSTTISDRSVSFIETSALAFAAAAAQHPDMAPPALQVGLGARYGDKTLSWANVSAFMTSLSQAQLLTPGALESARGVFQRWSAEAGGDGTINGEISANLNLDQQALLTLMRIPQRVGGELNDDAHRAIVTLAIDRLIARQAVNRAHFVTGAGLLGGFALAPPHASATDLVLIYRDKLAKRNRDWLIERGAIPTNQNTVYPGSGGGMGTGSSDYFYFLKHAFGIDKLVELIDAIGDIYQAPSTWRQNDYEAAQDRMIRASTFWMRVADNLGYLFNADVSRRTATFMRIIADLAGMPGQGGVQVTMTWRQSADKVQTAAVG